MDIEEFIDEEVKVIGTVKVLKKRGEEGDEGYYYNLDRLTNIGDELPLLDASDASLFTNEKPLGILVVSGPSEITVWYVYEADKDEGVLEITLNSDEEESEED